MKKYLSIDLGGTQARVAIVDEEGNILKDVSGSSKSKESTNVIVNNIYSLVDKIGDLSEVSGIGICVPGPVDQEKGWMNMATNIPGLLHVPLVSLLEERYNLPVYMDNDANVAALAEALVGVGKGEPVVVYVTHSTGVGAGIVVNGQAVSGKHGFAGEIANIIVADDDTIRNHLNKGAVENVASGTALIKLGQDRLDPTITSGKEVFDLAQEGNLEAQKIVDEMTYYLAKALSSVAAVLDPHCIIIGGGVSQSHMFYWEKLTEQYHSMVHEGIRDMEFKLPVLKEPGIVGAGMLPRSHGK